MKVVCISLSVFLILFLIDVFCGFSGATWVLLLADLVVACSVLAVSPCSHEDPRMSMRAAVLLGVLSFVVSFVSGMFVGPDRKAMFIMATSITGVFVYMAVKTWSRFRHGTDLFSMFSIWYFVEDYARLFWTAGLFLSSMILLMACSLGGWQRFVMVIPATLSLVMLYAVFALRVLKRRTMILGAKRENEILSTIKKRIAMNEGALEENDCRMDGLFRRVEVFMNEKMPYLNEEFDLDTLSKEVYSNRLYLSRTIRQCSGKNFCQYVNGYRLKYVTERLMESGTRISDVAMEAGFHSISSFNMAFKTQFNLTPTEWVQMKRIEQNRARRSHLSNSEEQERLCESQSSLQDV